MAKQFVLIRIVNMRGVDLSIFDFDYDLTWAAFFLNANEKIYGRYGGRDEGPADKGLSLEGLKFAMQQALSIYQKNPHAPSQPVAKKIKHVEKFAAAARLKKGQCIHCHQVHDYDRQQRVHAKQWSRDQIWVYPPPENVGISLDPSQGNRVKQVAAESAAHRAGLQSGDLIKTVGGQTIASYADLQYALHRAPTLGQLPVTWQRNQRSLQANLQLKPDWRQSDISWRASMWTLEPRAYVYGKDLTPAQKRRHSLAADRLAFYQGKYVPPVSRRAGIRGGDIITGIDSRELKMNMLQFNVYVRLNYSLGDKIVFDLIRNNQHLKIPMKLVPQPK